MAAITAAGLGSETFCNLGAKSLAQDVVSVRQFGVVRRHRVGRMSQSKASEQNQDG